MSASPGGPRWRVRLATPGDTEAWVAMRVRLWPDEDAGALAEVRAYFDPDWRAAAFLAFDGADRAIGFAEATIRSDYVNGTQTSPVGFLEGLYVVDAHRRSGVGRALVQAVEDWTRAQGCTELASDALIGNTASHAAHASYGFEETERVVYFRKPVATPVTP